MDGSESQMAAYAAIDVGGTKIAVGIGNEDGNLQATTVIATDPGWSQDDVLDRIGAAIDQVARTAGVSRDRIERAGLGTPGPLDGATLLETSNLHAWKGLNWEAGLKQRLGVPVAVENDATAAGVGEWLYGAGQGTRDMVYVTVSTGIGSGIITAGQRYSGSRGNAGEFGHIVMEPDGEKCPAGHRGCLESLASGTAIRRLGTERQADSAYLSKVSHVETKDVFDGYESGDPICRTIVEGSADRLALGLSYLVDLFNPERIVVGGGVGTHAPASYRERLIEGMRRWSLPALAQIVTVVPAQLGEDSGLIGALALAVTG